MQKRIAFIAAAAALALALVGCGSSSSSSSQASEAASSQAASSQSAASEPAASAPVVENGDGTLDLDSAFDTLLSANPISNQFEIAAINIEYDFGLAADDVVAYKGAKSNDNGDAGLVLVLEVPSDKVDSVIEKLSTYCSDQAAFYGNYAEFAQAQENVKNYLLGSTTATSNGNGLMVLVFASNECADTSALSDAVSSVLGN